VEKYVLAQKGHNPPKFSKPLGNNDVMPLLKRLAGLCNAKNVQTLFPAVLCLLWCGILEIPMLKCLQGGFSIFQMLNGCN
jgi:hypothetical protein